MASNRPAPEAPSRFGSDFERPSTETDFGAEFATDFAPTASVRRPAWEEWNPTEESVRPVRGRHRVAKQRGGTRPQLHGARRRRHRGRRRGRHGHRADGKPPVSISLPDLSRTTSPTPSPFPAWAL